MTSAADSCKNIAVAVYRTVAGLFGSFFDRRYLDPNVPLSRLVAHHNCMQYLADIGNHEGLKILEIGSREVTGKSDARQRFAKAKYVGFDYYPGPNVDIVGDAHKLSQYFENEKFDVIYSTSVLEHLAMPWLVVAEVAKLLKVGGIVFVETHFSFSSHERPWHFYQFTDMGLRALFSPALGFECIEAGASNPIVGRFSAQADKPLKCLPVFGLYGHSAFLGRKVREVGHFEWENADLDEVVDGTKYPPGLTAVAKTGSKTAARQNQTAINCQAPK
jgi:SAM-dependent methyltransferase